MGEFFGMIYCWMEDFFSLELAEYLWGNASPLQTTNMFIGIGATMLGISLAIAALFYYVVNHPKLNNWWGWLIFCGVNAITNFVIGWNWVLQHYYDGKMQKMDVATGKMVDLNINESNIMAFGVANMIDAVLAFIIISYLIKWWSINVSRAPF